MTSSKNKARDLTILALFIAIMAALTFIPNLGFITIGLVSLSIVHLPVIVGTLVLGFKKGLILSLAFGLLSLIRAFTPAGAADVVFTNPLIAILPRLFIAPGTYGIYVLIRKLFTFAQKHMAKRSDGWTAIVGGIIGLLIGTGVILIIYSALSSALGLAPVWCVLISCPFGCLAGIGLSWAAKNKFAHPERAALSFGCTAGALSNTIFTLLAFYFFVPMFFPEIMAGDLATNSGFIKYLFGLLAVNGMLEAVVMTAIGTPLTVAINKAFKKNQKPAKEQEEDAAGN